MMLPRLRLIRERSALSQRDLATKASVSKTTVLLAEAASDVRPSTARKLAEALGVKPAELMGD